MINRLSTYFYLRPKVILALLLLPPLLWFLVVYIGSLITMLINSFFYLDGFTGKVVHEFTFRTYAKLLDPTNLQIFFRTTLMAASVTMACVIIAFPLSYYMAHFASPRMKTFLYLAVTLPLWSSYVVRVYSWKLILAQEGIISWFAQLHPHGLAAGSVSKTPCNWRSITFCFCHRYLYRFCLYLASLYDHPDPDRAGTRAQILDRSLRRPRRQTVADISHCDFALILPGCGCGLHFYLLTDPG